MEKKEVCENCYVPGGNLIGVRRVSDGERVYIHVGSCEKYMKSELDRVKSELDRATLELDRIGAVLAYILSKE